MAKVNWLKLGDNNNSYFHALVKERNKQEGLYTLIYIDGRMLNKHENIKKDIIEFYRKLVETKAEIIRGVDIQTIRKMKTLNREQALHLIRPVEEKEIWKALCSVGSNKAP